MLTAFNISKNSFLLFFKVYSNKVYCLLPLIIVIQAARLGILPVGRGKTMSSQGRGRGRGRGGRGRGSLNHMVVDHRPKALTVGFTEEEKDDLLQHFSVSF